MEKVNNEIFYLCKNDSKVYVGKERHEGMKRVGIVGGGISSLMAAYSLLKNNERITVTIFERGNRLEKRKCPIITKKVDKCIKTF